MQINSPPPSPRSSNGAISEDLERLILHCLEKAPEQRPEAADEVLLNLEALASALAGTKFFYGFGSIA